MVAYCNAASSARKEIVGDFMRLFVETGGTADPQFAYGRAER